MNELIKNLLEQLKSTSAGTKLVAAMAGLSFVAMIGLVAVVSDRRQLEPGFSGITDSEVSKVTKALADAGIEFDVSAPPGPYIVFVDHADRFKAKAAVYAADALTKPLKGIQPGDGMSGVFNSAAERRQGVRKRDQEEVELMLVQGLKYIDRAEVRTSKDTRTAINSRGAKPITAAATVHVNADLDQSQKSGIARIITNALGIEKKDLVILDQEGHILFDGTGKEGNMRSPADWLAWQFAHDDRLTAKASMELDRILGPNKASVTVTSEWNYEQSTTRTESESGQPIVLSETTDTTERSTPEIGGVAGLSGNTGGAENAPGGALASQMESKSQSSKTYRPVTSVVEKVNSAPVLSRLSVGLALDSSIESPLADQLSMVVKSMVGFDIKRGDEFNSTALEFFVEEPEPVDETETGAGAAATNPLMETLLRRGVELLTALIFIGLLLKSLKSSSKAGKAPVAQATGSDDELDVELLARANIDELLKSDPERVGSVLSSWARGESLTGTKS